MKHTPGPWLQSWDCDAPTGSDASPKYDGFEVVTNDGWPIAFLPIHFVFPPNKQEMNKRELDWDEAAANLRLISAAPDLLAALQSMLDMYVALVNCGDCGNWNAEEVAEVIQARAAIAKAVQA